MLGLAEKVRRAELAVHRLVRDDQRLGGSREEVDADPAEELALRFGDEHVPGADQHVHRLDGLGAERHRPDRLYPAEAVDLVRASEVLGGHDGRVRLALVGRRAGDDPLHPRDLRGDHAHVGGRDHRVLAARHVGADAVDRDVLVAEDDAGHRLALDVAERLFLDSCEVADLRLSELDVRPLACAHPSVAGIDRGPAQTELVRRPAVEPLRVFAHRRVAARVDRGEHLLDGAADLHVRLGLGVFADPGLEVAGHGILLLSDSGAGHRHRRPPKRPAAKRPDRCSLRFGPGGGR